MLKRILKRGDEHRAAEISRAKKELVKAEKGLAELDDLFAKLCMRTERKTPYPSEITPCSQTAIRTNN